MTPRNLWLCVSAGVLIGMGGLTAGEEVVALLVFTVIAASSVSIPVLGYAVAGIDCAEASTPSGPGSSSAVTW